VEMPRYRLDAVVVEPYAQTDRCQRLSHDMSAAPCLLFRHSALLQEDLQMLSSWQCLHCTVAPLIMEMRSARPHDKLGDAAIDSRTHDESESSILSSKVSTCCRLTAQRGADGAGGRRPAGAHVARRRPVAGGVLRLPRRRRHDARAAADAARAARRSGRQPAGAICF